MTNLLAVSGKIGVGKDLFTQIFQRMSFEKSTITWENRKFAYKLKQIASELTGIPMEDLEKQDVKASKLGKEWDYIDEKGNPKQLTVREMLIGIGHGLRVQVHPDIWVNYLFNNIQDKPLLTSKGGKKKIKGLLNEVLPNYVTNQVNVIISDLRYVSEAERVKKENGVLIRINSSRAKIIDSPSETELDNYEGFDFVIDNNGTIEELTEQVDEIGQVLGLWN